MLAPVHSRFLRFFGGSGAGDKVFEVEFETDVNAKLEPCVR